MRLRDIAVAVPSRRVTAQEVAEWTGGDAAFIADKIGIESRAFLGPDESPLSLAKQACDRLFERNPGLSKDKVGLLVFVTQNPEYRLPHSSALLQHALGLPQSAACFDVNLACSGFVYALSVAKGLMAADGVGDALVVTCDPYSRIMDKTDRDTVSVFGDAASASWLSSEKGAEIGRADFGTDGGGAEHLIVKAGGAGRPLGGLYGGELPPAVSEDYRLRMNGRAIFNFMMERVPKTVARCLEKNALSPADVDFFVFHQASKFMLVSLAARMRLPAEKVVIEIRDVGNTVSTTIPLALSRKLDRRELAGKRALVSGFGVGLSWATNVLTFGADLP